MDEAAPLWDDSYSGPRYTYGLRYRPLGYAQVPPGWIIRSDRPHPDFRFVTVDYPFRLPDDVAARFELTLLPSAPPDEAPRKGPTGGVKTPDHLIPVRCPQCDGTNVGTEEALTGTALVSGYDPQTGEFEYAETIVDFDSSTTQTSDDGRIVMFCRDCCQHFLFDPPAPTR